jgi:hypothetical protein
MLLCCRLPTIPHIKVFLVRTCYNISTLENTEGAISNGQSRETGNTGHTLRIKTTENRLWAVTQQKKDSGQLDPGDHHRSFLQRVECFPAMPQYRDFIVLLSCQVRSIQIRLGTLGIPPCPMVNDRAINSPGFVIIFFFC